MDALDILQNAVCAEEDEDEAGVVIATMADGSVYRIDGEDVEALSGPEVSLEIDDSPWYADRPPGTSGSWGEA